MATVNALDSQGEGWRTWVLHNLQMGCTPTNVLRAMTKSVWAIAPAQDAIDLAMAELGQVIEWRYRLPRIGPKPTVVVGDKPVAVLARLDRPNAVLLGNVLTPAECEELIAQAINKGLNASAVVDNDTGLSVSHIARTSSGMGFSRGETALLATIEARLAELTEWPVDRAEGLQILRYENHQQYKAHFDWFNPDRVGSASHMRRGGQRVGTTVVYLAIPELGGQTRFPEIALEMSPPLGGAIFFNSVDALGAPDKLSLHSGTPVEKGTKIVATYWQREATY